jgi:hypothetical protein
VAARHNAKWRAVEKRRQNRRFSGLPPTARQIENWQPVVYFSGNNAVFGFDPALWRAVVGRSFPWFANSVWERAFPKLRFDATIAQKSSVPALRDSKTVFGNERTLDLLAVPPMSDSARTSATILTYANFPGFVQRRAPRDPPTALSNVTMIADKVIFPLSAAGKGPGVRSDRLVSYHLVVGWPVRV